MDEHRPSWQSLRARSLLTVVLSGIAIVSSCQGAAPGSDDARGDAGAPGESSGGRLDPPAASGGRRGAGGGGDSSSDGGARSGEGGEGDSAGSGSGGAEGCLRSEAGTCVECSEHEDCTDSGARRWCEPSRGQCVECLKHSDCGNPSASRCDTAAGRCVPCLDPVEHSDCAHLEGRSICDTSRGSGVCVECTGAEQGACGSVELGTCDLVARECVPIGSGDRASCEPCTNDLQCARDHRCVPLYWQEARLSDGGFCLPVTGNCQAPFFFPINRPSLGNTTGHTYCGIHEALTTCEAVLALKTALEHPCVEDADCPTGGICRTLNESSGRFCTYRCTSETQCRPAAEGLGHTCPFLDADESNDYCGGVELP